MSIHFRKFSIAEKSACLGKVTHQCSAPGKAVSEEKKLIVSILCLPYMYEPSPENDVPSGRSLPHLVPPYNGSFMRSILRITAIVAVTLSLFSVESTAQVLTYGDGNVIDLVEGVSNQRVDFFVNDIAGRGYDTFELFIQIGDGGTIIGGTDTGPSLITPDGVELGNAGTVFEGGTRSTSLGPSQTPLLWADFIDGVVAEEDGIVGTLIFDASGFSAGTTIDIIFEGVVVSGNEFNTNFRGADNIPSNLDPSSNGIIRVVAAVPEPTSSIAIVALAGIMGLRRRR